VTVTDADGATFTFTTPASVKDAPLPDMEVGTIIAQVGVAVPKGFFVARFQDSNVGGTVDDFVTKVDYGDGNGPVAATVVADGGGSFELQTANPVTYKTPGDHQILVYVRDQGDNIILMGSNDADVAPAAPPPPNLFAAAVLIGRERAALVNVVVAGFIVAIPGANPADFAARIDWGDGIQIDGVIKLIGGTDTETHFQVIGSHTYDEEGSYSVDVTVTTQGANPQTVSNTAEIADAPLTAEHAFFNAPEGVSMTQYVATFTDDNEEGVLTDYTATIDWGDGTLTPGTITQPAGPGTPYLVSGTHQYDDSGGSQEMDGFPVVVTIKDVGGSVAYATSQANVFDPVLIDPGTPVGATEARAFQGQVATFSSSNPEATTGDFTAIVNWGDGQSSSGTILPTSGGGFQVVGNHTYTQAGVFSVSTTVRDDEGQSVSDTSVASVADAPIAAGALSKRTTQGKSFNGALATFTDPNGAAVPSNFSILINWGDGTSSSGVAVETGSSSAGASFTVFGSHAYARSKKYSTSVLVRDSGGSQLLLPIRIGPGGPAAHPTQSGVGKKAATKPAAGARHPQGPLATSKPNVASRPGAPLQPMSTAQTATYLGPLPWARLRSKGAKH
jgi:hypothetical protein